MIYKAILQFLNVFYIKPLKILPFNVYAYLAVGAANTLFNILAFLLFYKIFINQFLNLEIATALAFILSAFSGYWLNRNFAFGNGSNTKFKRTQFSKYVLVALSGQIIDYLITKGFVIILDMNPVASYITATIIVITSTYLGQKYFTFKTSFQSK